MNEHFVNVKVDREERPDVDAIYMDATRGDDRPGRLADDGVPHARGRAVLRRHVLPAGAAPRHAVVPQLLVAVVGRMAASGGTTSTQQARRLVDAIGNASRAAAVDRSADADAARRGRARHRRAPSSPRSAGSAGRRSSRRRRRSSCSCARGTATQALAMVDGDARRHGRRRDVRPRRRRLPPLLGRRPLARARTSRRCSTTTRCSPPRTSMPGSSTGDGPLPAGRRGDRRLRAARAARSRAAGSRRPRTQTPTASKD